MILGKFLNQYGINGIFANTCTYQDTDDEGNPITEKTEILGLNINGSNKFSLINNVSGLVSTTRLNDTKKIRSYEKNLLGLHAGKITKASFKDDHIPESITQITYTIDLDGLEYTVW